MDNWPALKTKFGHKLIDIDFDVKYPEKSNSVFDKWTEFSKEIVSYYEGNIKDPRSAEMLRQCKMATNDCKRLFNTLQFCC